MQMGAEPISGIGIRTSSSAIPGAKQLEQWNQEVLSGSPSSYPHLMVSELLPAILLTEEDLQIRIRWEGTSPPYDHMHIMGVINELRGIIGSSKNPAMASMVITAVDKLKNKDLDIFIYKI